VDNDGNPLLTGALYFNDVVDAMKVYNGSSWDLVAPDTSNFIDKTVLTGKGSILTASGASTPAALTVASTNGYILAVNSATATGLEWIINDVGDITAVTAGTGVTITNDTGPVPTIALTVPVVESSGGTNQTSYTTGDLLYASATNTLSKRGIGTTGQVLTVTSGVPTWETPATVDTQPIEVMTLMGAYI